MIAVAVLFGAGLAGCHGGAPPAQVAVTGDGFEVTLAELEQLLQQAPPVPKDQLASARRQVLDALVDEKLLAQAATDTGLDRETDTVQSIEAARRSILARAYVRKLVGDQPPDDAALRRYYADHPQAFAGRKLLRVREVSVPMSAPGAASRAAQLDKLGFDGLVAQLTADNQAPTVEQRELYGDAVPAAALTPGSNIVYRADGAVHLGTVTAAEPSPVSFPVARDALIRRVTMERDRQVIAARVAQLRKDRHVEVVNQALNQGAH